MSAFSDRHVRAVQSVRSIWPSAKLVVVGGLAVAHHTKMPWRNTKDIDFAIGIEVDEFPGALDSAAGWESDPEGNEHCRLFEGNLPVDFLPVGPDAASKTQITWPGSGHPMTVIGFDLAFEHQSLLDLEGGVQVAVADLAVVIILKMIAFLDRPKQRQRDVQDILAVLRWHADGAGDRLFEEQVVKLDLPADEAAAFLIGVDVAAVANARCLPKIRDFREALHAGHLDLAAVMCGMSGDMGKRLWAAMQAGLDAR